MDLFISSVDRLLPNCSFCFTNYFKEKLGLNYINSDYTFDDCSIDDFYFPDYFQIYNIGDCIKDEYIEYIDGEFIYILLNLLNKEMFCINKKLKDILCSFREKKNIKEVFSLDEYMVNKEFFLNLVYNGLLKKALEYKDNHIDREDISQSVIHKIIKEEELVQKISENGYSTSYLIEKENNYYILKYLFKSEYYSQKEILLNEIHIRNKLQNPDFFASIICYDLKSLFVITEYIQGTDLNIYINNFKPSISKKILIIKQIIEILSCLHRENIIHGDIHLGQFRMTPEGNLKLLDLELAIDLNKQFDDIEIAGGSFEYLEPESITNDPFNFIILTNKNKEAEIYRLGVMIYYIIYNEFPFLELTWKQLFSAKTMQNPEFPAKTKALEDIPYFIIKIIKKCLNSNPKNRYNSCDEIIIN